MNLDVSKIAPNLWQGSNPPHGPLLRQAGFDVLVLCAYERQYPSSYFPGMQVLKVPLDDGHVVPKEQAKRAGAEVARLVRAGKKVLVVCNMGVNRSGLVTALALWHLTGLPGSHCLLQVQQNRRAPSGMPALCNPVFADFLLFLPARKTRRQKVSVSHAV